MPDPFQSLKSIDAALKDAGQWGADAEDYAEWAVDLAQPFDDCPAFDAAADPEVDPTAGLSGDRSHYRTPTRRLFRDYRADPNAYKHLDPLPQAGESLHAILSGRYALWDLVPALIERTGQPVDELYLCTLSYSKANAADLLGLLDDGQVRRVALIVSYYFKSTSRAIYDSLVPALLERGFPVLAMRSHAKVTLARMADGAAFVMESSANLRSCKNIENATITRCPDLYAFHRAWMEDELLKPRRKERADRD